MIGKWFRHFGMILLIAGSATLLRAAPPDFKVGLVLDRGGKDDKSFNSSAYQGASDAKKKLGVFLKYVEAADDNAFEPMLGAIAALTSKSGKVGFVGGMDIPLIRRFEMGYEAGAKKANPAVTVLANYVGISSEAWNNPPKGKELAMSQYEAGADVIFAAAGASGLGVFDAAEEKKKFAIGVDANQDWTKPGLILTSMLKRVDLSVYSTIEDAKAGKFTGGVKRFGLADKGIDYSVDQYNAGILAESVRRRADELKSEIIAGTITVPDY